MSRPLEKIIPAYAYVQYRDDKNIVAFFDAFNDTAQQYLNTMNGLKLPYWPSPVLEGNLLDWVVGGIYGEIRPEQQLTAEEFYEGMYNTEPYDETPYAQLKDYKPGIAARVPDEFWKRILTWNFYKADGQQFTITWLKRRIMRFLYGPAGVDPRIENTYAVSVTVNQGVFTIQFENTDNNAGSFLRSAIEQGMVYLPFQYTYNVTVLPTEGS